MLTRLRCVRDVLTPCAGRMILLTSSSTSIPSSAMSNAGGREWARMGGILYGAVRAVHGEMALYTEPTISQQHL